MILDEYKAFFNELKKENKLEYQLTIHLEIVHISEELINGRFQYVAKKLNLESMQFDTGYDKGIEFLMFAISINEKEVEYISQLFKSPISGYLPKEELVFVKAIDKLDKDELFLSEENVVYEYILKKLKLVGLNEQYSSVILDIFVKYFRMGIWKPSYLLAYVNELINKKKIVLSANIDHQLIKESEFVYKVLHARIFDSEYTFSRYKNQYMKICKDSFFERNFKLKDINGDEREETALYTAYKQCILFLMDDCYFKDAYMNNVFKKLKYADKQNIVFGILEDMFNTLKEYSSTI